MKNYVLHRSRDRFLRAVNWKVMRSIPVLLAPWVQSPKPTKKVLFFI